MTSRTTCPPDKSHPPVSDDSGRFCVAPSLLYSGRLQGKALGVLRAECCTLPYSALLCSALLCPTLTIKSHVLSCSILHYKIMHYTVTLSHPILDYPIPSYIITTVLCSRSLLLYCTRCPAQGKCQELASEYGLGGIIVSFNDVGLCLRGFLCFCLCFLGLTNMGVKHLRRKRNEHAGC